MLLALAGGDDAVHRHCVGLHDTRRVVFDGSSRSVLDRDRLSCGADGLNLLYLAFQLFEPLHGHRLTGVGGRSHHVREILLWHGLAELSTHRAIDRLARCMLPVLG